MLHSFSKFEAKYRVADPGGVDLDPILEKKPDSDPILEKKPDSDPILEKKPGF